MNAVITYSRYGGPDVLSLSDADTPEPGPGQVRIRVRAVAVNPIDAKIRSGRMDGIFPIQFPVLPGWDVAGVVDVAGPGATAVRYGDGWTERVRAAAPDGVDAGFDTTGAGLLPGAISLAGDRARVITIADDNAADHGVRVTPLPRASRSRPRTRCCRTRRPRPGRRW